MMDAFVKVKRLVECSRCGDTHHDVHFIRLTRPFAPPEAGGLAWTHWAPCPRNGEPIMMINGSQDEDADCVPGSSIKPGKE